MRSKDAQLSGSVLLNPKYNFSVLAILILIMSSFSAVAYAAVSLKDYA